jgi:hypothetical protein
MNLNQKKRARGFEFARVGGWSDSRVEGMGGWVGGGRGQGGCMGL